LNDEDQQSHPWISSDGTELYYTRENRGIWVARRDGPGAEFVTPPEPVFASPFSENGPSLSADGTTLFFGEWTPVRPGGMGESDLYMLRRPERSGPFIEPEINLDAPLSTAGCETTPSISSDWPADGSVIYFARSAPCELDLTDIYRATWHVLPNPPAPAFLRGDANDDGAVNISDPVRTLTTLFAGEPAAGCLAAENSNGDEVVNTADPVYLLNHLFSGGPAPVSPYPECGRSDLPPDEKLGCDRPPASCE
jgi:hypothetical protein